MNRFLERALNMKDEMIENRRHIHQNAELGLELPKTSAFVESKLKEMGYEVKRLGSSGLTAVAGDKNSENVILIRADMDALPMKEESGLPFATHTNAAHCCGHDMHTTMLLAAAKMLKETESELKGAVKFLFQPGEEVGLGAEEMVKCGILENPVPKAVFACHVNAKSPLLKLNYGKGSTFCSNSDVKIKIIGSGGHGARAHEAIDPLKVGAHVYMALQSIKANSVSALEPVIFTITGFNCGGTVSNLISDTAEMIGTVRAYNPDTLANVKNQIKTIAETVASAFGAKAEVEFIGEMDPLVCASEFTDELLEYAKDVFGEERVAKQNEVKMGSEDFAAITKLYPDSCAYFFIGAGPDENTPWPYGQHNTKVVFNEDLLPYGAAFMANAATEYLKKRV